MTCTACGTRNDPGRKFCVECGTRLAVACPSCGSPNPASGKFCGECGTALGGADAPQSPSGAPASAGTTPVAERRLVSILFADLVGFTSISETRDAEEVRELLARYFTECRDIIGRYGGTVEKFIGDAVMAVWGTPVAQEDDAERAVRAALDLVDAARRIGEAGGIPALALRAGVLTGEAAVTIGASDMGMVAGDLVNTASRLQSVAAPGTVLVGDATRRASSDAIAYEPVEDQALKGKELPVVAWRAKRVIAKRGGAGRSDQLEAPFVGRAAELQLIKDFYHGTARERGVRLVSVIGQGGIGKSRLAWEFLKYIDGVTEIVYWHQGRSPAYGEGITFWALGEMVRMRLGIGEGAGEEATRTALAAVFEEFVPDSGERRQLEGPLLQLLGFEDRSGAERGELFAAWRTFFERIAEAGPVVLVFEDLQWADEGLIDFIEDLLAWSRARPIYIITLARPELLDRRPTWGAGQRGFTSLGLEPLGDEEMLELLNGLVPGLPDAAVRTVVARAEGVPLYAVETVRMLLNDGRIEEVNGTYRPTGDLAEFAVPETLHALIAARLDGLDPAERALLQDASVIGLTFSGEALSAVSGVSPDEIEQRLRHLAQRELIVLEDDPRSPERGLYRFVQGLIKEVAYSMLARRERRARHIAAARYFEAVGDDDLAGVLAEHYVEAYRAQPDGEEGAAVAAQARVALRAAAVHARGLGSPARALAYLQTAIDITADPADELELRTDAAHAAVGAGRLEGASTHLERAVELATAQGADGARRRAIAALAHVLTEGRQEQARRLLTEALAEPGLTAADDGYVDLAEAMASILMRSGNHAEAVRYCEQALPAAEERQLTQLTVELLITRGVSLSNVNRTIESLATLTGAMEIADRHNFPDSVFRAAINVAYAIEPEDPRAGLEAVRSALGRARRVGRRWAIRYLVGNASEAAIQIGDWDWALDQIRDASSEDDEAPERLWFGAMETQIAAARGVDVDERVAELRQLAAQFDDPQYLGLAAAAGISAGLASGRYRQVIDLVVSHAPVVQGVVDAGPPQAYRAALRTGDAAVVRQQLETYASARKGRRTTADREAMEGGRAALEGRRSDARAHYLEALRLHRELDLSWLLAQTGLEATIAGAFDGPERQRVADEARVILERLGARPYLEELDRALRSGAAGPARAPEIGAGADERTSPSEALAPRRS